MHYSATSCVLASLLLSGCSLFSSPEVEQTQPTDHTLKVPSHLTAPPQPAQYDIPAVSEDRVQQVDTRAPGLVLTLSSSSRVDEEETRARVWFDRNDYSGDLLPFLQQMLTDHLQENDIAYTVEDDEQLVWLTDWVSSYQQKGFWFWKSNELREQARFRITMEPRPHGRSVAVLVEMTEHQYYQRDAELLATAVKREETAFLNGFIAAVGAEEFRQAQALRNRTVESNLTAGVDAQSQPALLSDQSLEVVWTQLEDLFAAVNLSVLDLNRSVSTYYVRFDTPKRGMFSRVFRRNTMPVLPLADGEYQVVLGRVDQLTSISFRDKSGEPLAADVVASLERPLLEAIEQASLEL
ncbi:MAG: outer membrane protein assembly factor BamC [Alkalimonas sp.]|nr:outer membrane protein assembly factor BamC [Alkalimonas sp.]